MNYSVKKSENTLFVVKLFATALVWVSTVVSITNTINQPESMVIIITIFVYITLILLYIFFHKVYLVAYMKGQGICVSEAQFPEVYTVYCEIAKQLELKKVPPLFILQSGGMLNAFATRLSGKNYVAIYSDIFALYKTDIETVKFVLAHELGHVKRKHMQKMFWTLPSSFIPFLTSAYSRSCEYTCDNIGSSFVLNENSKVNGLLLLAGGKDIYKEINIENYTEMARQNRSLAVSFINLFISHPYLPSRIRNIQKSDLTNYIARY